MFSATDIKIAIWLGVALKFAAAGGDLMLAADGSSSFCAIQLEVKDTDGKSVGSALADLIDKSGRIVRTEKVVNGRAEFCDFGFGRYSILVHDAHSFCGAAEIKGVHVIYGLPQHLVAVLNYCADGGDWVPVNACAFYVRVAAPDGRPLGEVQIKSQTDKTIKHTDKYGRALLSVGVRDRADYTFAQPGYKPKSRRLSCPSLVGPPVRELLVTLDPEDPPRRPGT